jgi:hypothetical protein
VRKLHEYDEEDIRDILHAEGWDRALPPVTQVKPSGWLSAAFWTLRIYVTVMLAVVGYAFLHGAR